MSFTPVATTDTLETFRTRYNATNITLVDDSSTTVDITLATDSLKLSGGTGITSAISGDTITHTLNNTSVSAGSFGSATAIPVITVDAQGRITAASTAAASSDLTIVDDSSTATTISLTTDTLKIAGGTGISTSISGDTLTVAKTGGVAYRSQFVYTATANQTTFTGADSASNTLAYQASNRDVYLNGVLLAEADFTATNGTSVVLGAGAAVNDVLTVFNYETTSLSLPDLNGTELILDADGDTSLHADTDDQIDIRIGGADDFAFKANKFEVQSGSNIDMNGTELILDADGDTSITADTDDQIDIKVSGADDFQIVANNFKVLSGSTLTIESGATIANSGTSTGFSGETAADDVTTGDAAVTIATSAGNITLDAQGNDTDIIFKGTDGSSDTTFLTIDGSEAGLLLPNNGIDLNGKELILDADADTSITADTDDQIDFKLANADVLAFKTTGIHLPDGKISHYGSGDDFAIKHDGSGAFLENGTGNLNLRAKTGEASIIAIPDGAVELYHNNVKKLETTAGGIAVTTASSGATANSAADEIVLEGSGDCGMSFLSGTSGAARIYFGDSGNALSGVIKYDHALDAMLFSTSGAEEMRLESDGDLHVDGDVIAFSTTTPSDIALKSDIEVIPNALDKLDEIRGVTFTRHNGTTSAGIIAQELEKVLPEAVSEKTLSLHDGKEYKTVEYNAIHGLLIQAIKELKDDNTELKSEIDKLKNGG